MKITAQEEYGLRCLLQIAKLTDKNELASLNKVAASEKLTPDYAAKLIMILRQGGFVESVRGKSGGYKLTRAPEDIYLDEIIRALSGEIFETNSCNQFPGNDLKCVHLSCCSIRSVWLSVSHVLFTLLKQITLKDLLEEKEEVVSGLIKKKLLMAEREESKR